MRRLTTFLLMSPLLAASALTAAAQSPTTTDELLSGMVTEEVEPGVYRVINDGVRDIAKANDFDIVVAGHDGGILLVRGAAEGRGSFVRLGSEGIPRLPKGWDRRLVVTPEGTVWVSGTLGTNNGREVTRVHSLENGKWTRRLRAPAFGGPQGLIVAPDGSVWATHPSGDADDSDGVVVTRFGADDWERLGEPAPDRSRLFGDFFVTQSGEVWMTDLGGPGRWIVHDDDGAWWEEGLGSLWRYDEDQDEWQEVTVDAVVHDPGLGGSRVEVGADGSVWFAGVEPLIVDGEPVSLGVFGDHEFAAPGDSFLLRYDGTRWQRWGPADGVPTLNWSWGLELKQAPDGGLWMVAPPDSWLMSEDAEDLPFEGIARFDGSDWRYFLSDHSVSDWDITPHGSVWLRADGGLYVITPEAVAE